MMSDNPEATAYIRLIAMYIDLATDTVLKVFFYLTPNQDIDTFFTSTDVRKKLEGLFLRRRLSKKEYELVTRPRLSPKNFDISLLITLLSNLYANILPAPMNGWNSAVNPRDHTIAADLLRLRNIRNNILAHSPRGRLQEFEFEKVWNDVENILVRLTKQVHPDSEASLKEKIGAYKTRHLGSTDNRFEVEDWYDKAVKLQEKSAAQNEESASKWSDITTDKTLPDPLKETKNKRENSPTLTTRDFSTPDSLANDPYTRILYKKALEEGTEEDSSIRVMVIGCYGQGKTSLVRRLVQQPLKDVMTTNGIEVQRCKCSKDGAWEAQILEDLEVESSKRLAYVAKSTEGRINKGTGEKCDDFVPLVNDNTEVKENTAVTLSTTTAEENLKSNINRNYPVNTDIKKEVTDEILTADQSNTFMDQVNHVTDLKIFSEELIRHRQTSNMSKESDISLNIWDFGGQFVYYATHQVFLSRKSVYILVFNIAEGLDKTISDPDFPGRSCNMTMRDYLRFWVTSVHSFVGAEDGTEPTIIMVGTHKDEIKEGINTDDIFEDIRKMFDDTSAINHFHSDQFVVSNTSLADESIDILRKTVLDVGRRQAKKVAVPAKWILLEKELKKIRNKKIVTLEEVLEVDRGNYSRVQTETQNANNDQIRLFLRYHHALGSFCYFDDRNLSKYIVVDPQFLIDAFSCIVTSEQFCRVRYTLRKMWRKLCETAILEPELLEEVWRKNPGEEFHKFKKLLTEFLQKHRIISEVLKYDEKGTSSPQPLGFYIVPSFLKVPASDVTVGAFLDGKPAAEVSLGYIFKNEALTPTLFQKLLAAVVGRWPLLKFKGQFILFSNIVACELQSNHAGLLIQAQNKLELLIVNLCPVKFVRPDVCDMFRRFVEMVIEHEFCRFRGIEEYASQRDFTTYLRCFHKQHGFKGSEDILELIDIPSQSDRHFPCPDRASHCLEMNLICQQWYRHQVTIGDIPKRRLTEKQYSALSMAIGQGWQQIGRHLGLGDISLQHIDMDNKTTDMKIFYMFLKWDENELDRATLDVLVKAIQECGQIASVNWDVVKNIVDGF